MWKLPIIWLTLFSLSGPAGAQCCSPGSPIGGTGNLGVLPAGVAKLVVNYGHSYSGSYYEGSKSISPVFVESGYYNSARIGLSYGVGSSLTVDTEATYFVNKVQKYVEGILPAEQKGDGVGDVSFVVNYRLLGTRFQWWEVTTGIGLKVPAGTYRQQRGGARLPLDVQPTTGAVDFVHTLFLHKGYPQAKLRFFLTNRIELKNSNAEGYRYGNLYATSVFASRNLGVRWDAMLALRSEVREKDERPTGSIPVTGSRKLFLAPQINYTFDPSLSVTAVVDLPVYQHYNGAQLANEFGLGIALYKKFGANPRPRASATASAPSTRLPAAGSHAAAPAVRLPAVGTPAAAPSDRVPAFGTNAATPAALLPAARTYASVTRSADAEGAKTLPPDRLSAARDLAPDFERETLDGDTLRLSDLRGRVVVLNFWATWCAPCRVEIPELIRLHHELAPRGVTFVGVSLDADGFQAVRPFAEKMGINYPLVIGDEALVDAYGGVFGLPMTFVIDRSGHIRQRFVGMVKEEILRPVLLDLLD